jgi:hypothetical protein
MDRRAAASELIESGELARSQCRHCEAGTVCDHDAKPRRCRRHMRPDQQAFGTSRMKGDQRTIESRFCVRPSTPLDIGYIDGRALRRERLRAATRRYISNKLYGHEAPEALVASYRDTVVSQR